MNAFAPTPSWFIERFKCRGIVDDNISFSRSDISVALDQGEESIIFVKKSEYSSPCWLTTKRFIYGDIDNKRQIILTKIEELSFKILPDEQDEMHAIALMVKAEDDAVHDIRAPNVGILKGILSIFHRFERLH